MGDGEREKLGIFHAALQESVQASGEETTGPEIGFAEGIIVCIRAGGGDVFWVVGWWILARISDGCI
jgi:hypothetical protein